MTPRDKGSVALPYYRWYVADYRGSLRVQSLSWQARAIYRELLDEIWRAGCIPDDVQRIAEISRVPLGVVAKHWPTMRGLFMSVPYGDGQLLTSERLDAERGEAERMRVQKAIAGRAGGKRKAANVAAASTAYLAEQFRAEQSSSRAPSAPAALEGAGPRLVSTCQECGTKWEGFHKPGCSNTEPRAALSPTGTNA